MMKKLNVLIILCFLPIFIAENNLPSFNHSLPGLDVKTPLNIAHRGASGERPDHTEGSYKLAIEQGAHFIECDICLSRDLIPVCHHDCYLNATTDVHSYPNFHSKARDRDMAGLGFPRRDYYTVDFTWEELKTLKIKRKSGGRNPNYDLKYRFLSFEDHIKIAQNASRTVGIYPELKAAAWANDALKDELKQKNTSFEKIVVEMLHEYGYDGQKKPCYLQSFEEETAKILANLTNVPVIFLTPLPIVLESDLERLSKFAAGIGITKLATFLGGGMKPSTGQSTNLVERIHSKNMKVHVWTFSVEDRTIPWIYGDDVRRQYDAYIKEKVDGLFTDYPYSLSEHLNYRYRKHAIPDHSAPPACPTVPNQNSSRTLSMSVHFLLSIITIKNLFIN